MNTKESIAQEWEKKSYKRIGKHRTVKSGNKSKMKQTNIEKKNLGNGKEVKQEKTGK